jgi:hypothetical protein
MIIDIDRMFFEMKSTMECNFSGTPKQRYKQAKKSFLESVAKAIEENKEGLIKEFETRQG